MLRFVTFSGEYSCSWWAAEVGISGLGTRLLSAVAPRTAGTQILGGTVPCHHRSLLRGSRPRGPLDNAPVSHF